MRVAICVITLRRPEGLRALLDGLAKLSFSGPPGQLRVCVIDNDAEGSAGEVCRAARQVMPWSVNYCIEPRRGFAFARNRAVQMGLSDAEWIAFIDDDEIPEPQWLQNLMRAQCRYDADVVTGPVIRQLPESVPDWMRRGQAFQTRRFPTGTVRPVAFTSNVLTSARVFRSFDGPFDERVCQTGCEDLYLYRRAARAGFKIVWADDAIVYERIGGDRATARWLLTRAYRVGSSRSVVEMLLDGSLRTRSMLAGAAAWRAAKGIALLPTGLVVGTRGWVRATRHLTEAAGMVAGMWGYEYDEYRRTHRA